MRLTWALGNCFSAKKHTTLVALKNEGNLKMPKKKKHAKCDGLGPREIEEIRKAIRLVWSRSLARSLVVKRCTGSGGFLRCEQCLRKVPKIAIDHIERVGAVDGGFIARLFCPSTGLQGLCHECHGAKTKQERAAAREGRSFL